VRALLTVFGASTPAWTSAIISSIQCRTIRSSMRASGVEPRLGNSRLRPWASKSSAEPLVT
jgi:hypothetical protein